MNLANLDERVKKLVEGFRANEQAILERTLGNGWDIVRQRTEFADAYFTQRFEELLRTSGQGHRFVIGACASNGRKELCPGSDTDIILLHEDGKASNDPFLLEYAELLRQIFDSVPFVGGRDTFANSLNELPTSNTQKYSSLLDLRMLSGDEKFYSEIMQLLKTSRDASKIVRDKIAEIAQLTERYPDGITDAPFNVKVGVGGLRHFHNAVILLGIEGYKSAHEIYQELSDEVLGAVGVLLKARAWLNLKEGLTVDNGHSAARIGCDVLTRTSLREFELYFGDGSRKLLYYSRRIVSDFADSIVQKMNGKY